MRFRLPLLPFVHDRRADRSTPVAAVELTETELRLLAVATAHSAVTHPIGWGAIPDVNAFDGLSRRMKRVADELRQVSNQNGAAVADTTPRHGSTEVPV